MISTVDLTRKGLLRVIGYLEVTQLPAPERFNAAINDLVSWVTDHPDDLDRFFAESPVSYPKWETDKVLAEAAALAVVTKPAMEVAQAYMPMDLADYDHAGFKAVATAGLPASQYGMPNPS